MGVVADGQRYDTIETTCQYIALTYYNFWVNSENWEKQYENCSGWMIHKEMRDKITKHRWKGFAFYLLVSACASLCQINKLNAFKFMPSSCQFPQDVQNVSSFLHRTTQLNVKPNRLWCFRKSKKEEHLDNNIHHDSDFKWHIFCHLLERFWIKKTKQL